MNNRSTNFRSINHNRYWWHRAPGTDYDPLIYSFMSADEWDLMLDWFEDTERLYESTGEANIPPLSFLFGLISGNALSRIVQCGHYVGYSTLLIGFLLRRMGKCNSLFSIDIDPEVTAYTANWLSKANLNAQCALHVADSADSTLPALARNYFGGDSPQMVFIDSSHQYEHTLKEMELWYSALPRGGFLVLHDTSKFASCFDSTGKGGVLRGVAEWCAIHNCNSLMVNSFVEGGKPGDQPYLDGCGLAILQKTSMP
jgi:predicted O-methyltransferase YrrM